MRARRHNGLSGLIMVLALYLPVVSLAESPRQRAAGLFRAGNEQYARGDVKGALERFIEARGLFPSYKLDLNIATCLYDMGRHADAAKELERFLEKAEKAPPATVKEAHVRLQKLRKTLASVKLVCAVDGATILVDGKEVGRTPLKRRIYLRPGLHELKLRAKRYAPFARDLELRIDEHREMVVALQKRVQKPGQGPTVPATRPARITAAAPGVAASAGAHRPEDDGGVFVNVLLGPYWADYGADVGEQSGNLELGGGVGYLWRAPFGVRQLGVYVKASALYAAASYKSEGKDYPFGFLNILAGGGLRLNFWRLWADLGVALGPSLMLGADEGHFLFKAKELSVKSTEPSGVPIGFAVRSSLGIGWTFWKGLTLTVFPVALDYMPSMGNFRGDIAGVLHYQVAVGMGWQS